MTNPKQLKQAIDQLQALIDHVRAQHVAPPDTPPTWGGIEARILDALAKAHGRI